MVLRYEIKIISSTLSNFLKIVPFRKFYKFENPFGHLHPRKFPLCREGKREGGKREKGRKIPVVSFRLSLGYLLLFYSNAASAKCATFSIRKDQCNLPDNAYVKGDRVRTGTCGRLLSLSLPPSRVFVSSFSPFPSPPLFRERKEI